jgi:hypothetical protein
MSGRAASRWSRAAGARCRSARPQGQDTAPRFACSGTLFIKQQDT